MQEGVWRADREGQKSSEAGEEHSRPPETRRERPPQEVARREQGARELHRGRDADRHPRLKVALRPFPGAEEEKGKEQDEGGQHDIGPDHVRRFDFHGRDREKGRGQQGREEAAPEPLREPRAQGHAQHGERGHHPAAQQVRTRSQPRRAQKGQSGGEEGAEEARVLVKAVVEGALVEHPAHALDEVHLVDEGRVAQAVAERGETKGRGGREQEPEGHASGGGSREPDHGAMVVEAPGSKPPRSPPGRRG